jgi:hypothetical protein
MLNNTANYIIDPLLELAFILVRLLMISLPILIASFIFFFFVDIFEYFMMNSVF